MFVNFLHLLRSGEELECDDPGRPLSSDPVDNLDGAVDKDIPDTVVVWRGMSSPPGSSLDRITNAAYRYGADQDK